MRTCPPLTRLKNNQTTNSHCLTKNPAGQVFGNLLSAVGSDPLELTGVGGPWPTAYAMLFEADARQKK
jgi:hypothetical protein